MNLNAGITVLRNNSVASFLVWGGGASPQMYRHNWKIKITCNLYARASASETYRPLFSHMVWRYKRQYRTKHWHWENLWINYASERAWKLFPFSHSKTAISFNILLVLLILYLRNTYIFRSQITSSYNRYNQCSSCYYLWYGVVYKGHMYTDKTLTLRKSMYICERAERASLENFLAFLHSKTAISFNILLVFQILCRYKWHACRLTCSDKFRNVPTKLWKSIIGGGGGGGGIAPLPPPPPPRLR